MNHLKISALSAALIISLSGCGGGGGSSSSSTQASGGITATVPTVPTSVSLVGTSPTSTYVDGAGLTGSANATIYNQLNSLRLALGSGAMAQNTALDKAATAHTQYVGTNGLADPSFHQEASGQTGFTGVEPSDRAVASGYSAAGASTVDEVGSANGSPGTESKCVSSWSDSVYHMAVILEPTVDVGIGSGDFVDTYAGNSSTVSICVVNFGYKTSTGPQMSPTGAAVAYPYNGQTGVFTTFNNTAESPNPTPDLTNVGQPIGVNFHSAVTSVSKFTLTNSGTNVPVRIISAGGTTGPGVVTDPNAELSSGYLFLVPTAPLAPNTTYSASYEVIVKGVTLASTWAFTTGATATGGQ